VNASNNRLLLILTLAALIRLPFVFLTPAWQAPDEYPHFHYIRTLAETGKFPVSRPQFPDYEAYQPPLYYLVGAGVFKMTEPWGVPELPPEVSRIEPDLPLVVIALRLLSLVLGVATVCLAYRIGQHIFPRHSVLALALPVMLALHPTFVSNTTSITNDALANLLGALLVWVLINPHLRSKVTLVGVAWGAAFLTKHNLLPFAVLVLFVFWREKKSVAILLQQISAILAIALLVSGWHYLHNLQQYGNLLAINPGVETEFSALVWDWPRWVQVIRNYNWSFWCAFGRTYEIHLPAWFYLVFFLPFTLLVLVGAARAAFAARKINSHSSVAGIPSREAILFFLFGFFVYVAAALGYTASYPLNCAWGKYVFPFLIPIWALMLSALHLAAGQKFLKFIVVFLAGSFIFINMAMLRQLAHLQ
jgi:hypothetical protein